LTTRKLPSIASHTQAYVKTIGRKLEPAKKGSAECKKKVGDPRRTWFELRIMLRSKMSFMDAVGEKSPERK
jgi:hypothetical protein